MIGTVTGVAGFKSGVLCDLALEAEAPGVHFVWTEIRRDIGLRKGTWVENTGLQEWRQRAPYVGTGGNKRQTLACSRTSGEALQENGGRRGRDVQVDVVKGRVIEEAVSATEGSPAVARQEATPVR